MKLIIQIPCFNEEKTLPLVLATIPRFIKGIDEVETLIIDDGSSDKTVEVARNLGVNHIVRHKKNQGLAASFADGINECLKLGADIIVNTDGDNQYPQQDIPRLVAPIINGEADMVVANRQTSKIAHFSKVKKSLQWFGSAVVRHLSKTTVPDAVSGFRAYSREAALHMTIVTDFSYCIETIIHATHKKLAIASVDVETNPPTRKSRLFKSTFQHIRNSGQAALRIYTMYQPMKVFFTIGIILFLFGTAIGANFLYLYLVDGSSGHIQSLILAAVLLLAGFQVFMTGLVSDLISINRRLSESTLRRVKTIELSYHQIAKSKEPSGKRKNKTKARQIRVKGGSLRDTDRVVILNGNV